jgi:mono/diheme cytochrome c family protein
MSVPRHGIQAIACAGDVYIAAGGRRPYGDAPSPVNSVFVTNPANRCPLAPVAHEPASHPKFRTTRVRSGLVSNPTSLQFGPDGRLYVSEQSGTVTALMLHRNDAGRYEVLSHERIDAIREIPNHDDDGTPVESWTMLARVVGQRLGLCCDPPQDEPPAVAAVAPKPGSPERGRELYRDANCAGCHALERAGSMAVTGPPLDGSWALPAPYLEQSIVDPDAVVAAGYPSGLMWDYGRTLSRQQLEDLIAFIRQRSR